MLNKTHSASMARLKRGSLRGRPLLALTTLVEPQTAKVRSLLFQRVDPIPVSSRYRIVVSKLRCPVYVDHPAVVAAVGKWESRLVGGISKHGGKVRFWTFPPCVFSTAFAAEMVLIGLP
jgi:hypothetical protein